MIAQRIQAILEGICDAYGMVSNSDVLPLCPFAVHEEKIAETLRDKEGIYGFRYDMSVLVVGDNDSQVDPVVEQIIEVLEMLSEELINSVSLETTTGIQYDADTKKFHNQLNFIIETKNL